MKILTIIFQRMRCVYVHVNRMNMYTTLNEHLGDGMVFSFFFSVIATINALYNRFSPLKCFK